MRAPVVYNNSKNPSVDAFICILSCIIYTKFSLPGIPLNLSHLGSLRTRGQTNPYRPDRQTSAKPYFPQVNQLAARKFQSMRKLARPPFRAPRKLPKRYTTELCRRMLSEPGSLSFSLEFTSECRELVIHFLAARGVHERTRTYTRGYIIY